MAKRPPVRRGAHFPISDIAAALEDAKKDNLEEAKFLMARTPPVCFSGGFRFFWLCCTWLLHWASPFWGTMQDAAEGVAESTPRGTAG